MAGRWHGVFFTAPWATHEIRRDSCIGIGADTVISVCSIERCACSWGSPTSSAYALWKGVPLLQLKKLHPCVGIITSLACIGKAAATNNLCNGNFACLLVEVPLHLLASLSSCLTPLNSLCPSLCVVVWLPWVHVWGCIPGSARLIQDCWSAPDLATGVHPHGGGAATVQRKVPNRHPFWGASGMPSLFLLVILAGLA